MPVTSVTGRSQVTGEVVAVDLDAGPEHPVYPGVGFITSWRAVPVAVPEDVVQIGDQPVA